MAHDDEDDDGGPGLPMLLYLVIGILAVVGLFSISGWIFGAIFTLVRAVIVIAVVVLAFVILKAIFFGRRHSADV